MYSPLYTLILCRRDYHIVENVIFIACIFIVVEIQRTMRLFPVQEKAASFVVLLQEANLELS